MPTLLVPFESGLPTMYLDDCIIQVAQKQFKLYNQNHPSDSTAMQLLTTQLKWKTIIKLTADPICVCPCYWTQLATTETILWKWKLPTLLFHQSASSNSQRFPEGSQTNCKPSLNVPPPRPSVKSIPIRDICFSTIFVRVHYIPIIGGTAATDLLRVHSQSVLPRAVFDAIPPQKNRLSVRWKDCECWSSWYLVLSIPG